jgi:hypothetical protein
MGLNIFDPDDETLPDFCRDVLGMEPTPIGNQPEAILNGNSFLLLVYGMLVGLIIGFSLGTLVQTALLAGDWKFLWLD